MTKEMIVEYPHVFESSDHCKVFICRYCGQKPNKLNYDGECREHRKEKGQ